MIVKKGFTQNKQCSTWHYYTTLEPFFAIQFSIFFEGGHHLPKTPHSLLPGYEIIYDYNNQNRPKKIAAPFLIIARTETSASRYYAKYDVYVHTMGKN